jgi:hypothetical protein
MLCPASLELAPFPTAVHRGICPWIRSSSPRRLLSARVQMQLNAVRVGHGPRIMRCHELDVESTDLPRENDLHKEY